MISATWVPLSVGPALPYPRDEPRNQARLMGASLVVTDAEGAVILEFSFAEAMTGRGDGSVH